VQRRDGPRRLRDNGDDEFRCFRIHGNNSTSIFPLLNSRSFLVLKDAAFFSPLPLKSVKLLCSVTLTYLSLFGICTFSVASAVFCNSIRRLLEVLDI